MPNFDGGHYFFTAFVPIDNRGLVEIKGVKFSPVHVLRQTLELLPTALQSTATVGTHRPAPFAKCTRTHFARLFVIDDTYFNGRDAHDALAVSVLGPNPLVPQKVDRLNCRYLAFVADFDATSGDQPEVAGWLTGLWAVMEADLRRIFAFGQNFEAVSDAPSFAAYMMRCQVETTMPFHDYWVGRPQLHPMPVWQVLLAPAVALIGAVVLAAPGGLSWWTLLVFLGWLALLLVPALAVDYFLIRHRAQKPFPAAQGDTLPGVLKALYLQQKFTGFVLAQQGEPAAGLQAAFRAFVVQHQPDNLRHPTQAPGVIHADAKQPGGLS